MLDWYAHEVIAQHKERTLRAERRYLELVALESSQEQEGAYDQALAWLGGRLITLGRHLQARHTFTASSGIVGVKSSVLTPWPGGQHAIREDVQEEKCA